MAANRFIFIFLQLILPISTLQSDPSNTSPLTQDTQNPDVFRYLFQGVPGRDGRDGRDGHDGAPGLQGPAGPPGVNTVTTGSQGQPGPPGDCPGTSGSVYVRWGRTTCPSVSELAYAGIAGGKNSAHSGSGSNFMCLPEDPEFDEYQEGVNNYRAHVYSSEYEIHDFPPFASVHQNDPPCAVCRTTNRGSVMMIPAKMTCPSGWTKEYNGYLMAENYVNLSPSEFICVDRNPEVVPGSADNVNGAVFFPVEGRCDNSNLPCTPYINGAELTCVVCSK